LDYSIFSNNQLSNGWIIPKTGLCHLTGAAASNHLNPTIQEEPMSRFPIAPTVDAAPAAAQPLLKAVNAQLGVVPNLYRLLATTPAGLEGLLGLSGALGKGTLEPKTRTRIAITVAEVNGCSYCLSAHAYIAKNMTKLSDAEITANRGAHSEDAKADEALAFARKVVDTRGHVSEADVQAVKAAGYSDAQVLEIVLHVALNTLTNYVNVIADTDIDFPVLDAAKAA
jgi:uncharacterized peroxidase-related enzyme